MTARLHMHLWFVALFLASVVLPAVVAADELEQAFRSVPQSARPWVYWWWLNGNIDEKTIRRDLEAMKQIGVGGLLLFDARGYHDDEAHVVLPPPKTDFMSPQWRQMLRLALQKAHQEGLEVSINLSSCAGALKGPWEVGDDCPKKLIWQAAEVVGPQKLAYELKRPQGRRYWPIAIMGVMVAHAAARPERTSPDALRAEGWQEAWPRTALKLVDLTSQVDAQGRLSWDVEPGTWVLLQFGYVTMEGRQYDVDILDAAAVERHFGRMGKALLEEAGPLAGKTLTHFYTVSWEGALPSWTRDFEAQFESRRKYKIQPWLPVLAGFVVRTPEQSQRFLRDYQKTLAECFRDNYYGKLHELCRKHGLKWHAESGGPWNRNMPVFSEADQLSFLARTDMPQGEFWWGGMYSARHRGFNLSAAMTAHVYGKSLAAAEAFTHMAHHWSAYPAALKPTADHSFCEGINHLIWHTFTASPEQFGQPGIEYFAGTHLNPNVTWFRLAQPFLTYLARCQWMLRQGRFAADLCVYVGDKPYLDWSNLGASAERNPAWSQQATLTLPKGYSYDLLTTEVLLERLRVQDGDLVLPDGMCYRALVVDWEENVAQPAVLEQLVALARAGATVVLGRRRPERAPGLTNYPACDRRVQQLVEELTALAITNKSVEEVLLAKQILPDFQGPFSYTHRRTMQAEIYFVAGSGNAECIFRIYGKQPELWDAVTGQIFPAPQWRLTDDGRTAVWLSLPENGSMFVVFRKPETPLRAPGPPQRSALETLVLTGPWQVDFQPGRGAPTTLGFDRLVAWNEHPDEGVKFFSGTATYRKSFELSAEQALRPVRIQLGDVKHIAEVWLNGKPLGVVWTAPWSVEATGAVKPGRNELSVAVTNTWVNRLIGDARLPAEKRITRTNVALRAGKREPSFRPFQGFASEDPLVPSGLLGPVRLEFFDAANAR